MKSDLDFFEKSLSYKLYGIFLQVGKEFGSYCKEEVYQKACEAEFIKGKIIFVKKPAIDLLTVDKKKVGVFIPDFIIEDKIIIEIKAVKCLLENSVSQLIKYLEKSQYEIGYLVNFGTSYTQIIRRIYTNDRK